MASQNDAFSVNAGYAQLQLAKAFLKHNNADDDAKKLNAIKKIEQWQQVLQHMIDGQTQYGSRTPLHGVPAWVTLEVATGGFATGAYLAGGALQEHEKTLLSKRSLMSEKDKERLTLNAYFLTEAGLNQLIQWLEDGTYEIVVPEEAALLTIAYLLRDNKPDEARELVEKILPWFAHLRFYPVPLESPSLGSTGIRVQNIEESVKDLQKVGENLRIGAQKEAVEVWAPFKDKMVALFLRVFKDRVFCQEISAVWEEEAIALLNEFEALRKQHMLCGKIDKKKNHFYQLKAFLQRCSTKDRTFQATELGQIAFMIEQHVRKHGEPESAQNIKHRQKQQQAVAAPSFYHISKALIDRFKDYPKGQGLDDLELVTSPVTQDEAMISHVNRPGNSGDNKSQERNSKMKVKKPSYSPEVKERAIRMYLECKQEHPSQWSALVSIASKIGCSPDSLRVWVRQHEIDNGTQKDLSTTDRQRMKELERENRELRQANEILRKASAYFAQAELDRPRSK